MNNGLNSPASSPTGGSPKDTGLESRRFSLAELGELDTGELPVEFPRDLRRSCYQHGFYEGYLLGSK